MADASNAGETVTTTPRSDANGPKLTPPGSPRVKPLPGIGDLIDKLGLGKAQVRFIFSGGGVWFADSLELNLISCITTDVALTFSMGPAVRGLLVTIVYLGVFAGNTLSGPVSDRYGRRFCILLSYCSMCFFSILSSYAFGFWSLGAMRFVVGMCMGFGQPVSNTLCAEISPSAWRVATVSAAMCLFPAGELYNYLLVYLDDPYMQHLHWRHLLRLSAVPALVFFFVSCVWLRESPFWLSMKGRKEDAREVLEGMKSDNCSPETVPEVELDFKDPPPIDPAAEENTSEYGEVFSSNLLRTTLITMYTTFQMNFVNYGALYAFPNVVPKLGDIDVNSLSPAMECMIGALWSFPGYILAFWVCHATARKPAMKYCTLFVGTSMFLFVLGVRLGSTFLWHAGFYGVKASVNMAYVIVYLYVAEVYPTKVRTTGAAVCFAVGRFGAMAAPLAFEMLTSWTHSFLVFFIVNGCLCLINVPLIDLLPFETYNARLSVTDGNLLQPRASYGAAEVKAAEV